MSGQQAIHQPDNHSGGDKVAILKELCLSARIRTGRQDALTRKIKRAFCLFYCLTLYRMSINHRGSDIAMPQQFLNCADIIIDLQQMGLEAMMKRMDRSTLTYL